MKQCQESENLYSNRGLHPRIRYANCEVMCGYSSHRMSNAMRRDAVENNLIFSILELVDSWPSC